MLLVLIALAYLYATAGVHMLSTWSQARHDDSVVAALQREHAALVREHRSLSAPGTLETEARRLGMMRRGEQQYVVTGLPDN